MGAVLNKWGVLNMSVFMGVRVPEDLAKLVDGVSGAGRSEVIVKALRAYFSEPEKSVPVEVEKAKPLAAVMPSRDAHAAGCNCMLCQIRAKRGRG